MSKVFLRLREFAIEFPNGTVMGIGHLQPITKGWVVKIKDQTDFQGEAGMLTAIKIASQTTKTIAGYHDGDVELWDVVRVFRDENKAIEAAKQNGQMAIFQIETGTLRWV